MLFKNLTIYRFTKPFIPNLNKVGEALLHYMARPCGDAEQCTFGFVNPLSRNVNTQYPMLAMQNGILLLVAQRDEKVIPAQAVNDLLQARIEKIQDEEERTPSNKERAAIKDEVISSLLPRALTKTSRTHAYIDQLRGIIVVDAASAKKAEDFLSLLRKALGSLSVVPLVVKNNPTSVLTKYLADDEAVHSSFEVLSQAELKGSEGEKLTLKEFDLYNAEVLNHIEMGLQVTKLGLSFKSQISFVLTDVLQVKGVKYWEVFENARDELEPEDELNSLKADMLISSDVFGKLYDSLVDAFGGVALTAAEQEAEAEAEAVRTDEDDDTLV